MPTRAELNQQAEELGLNPDDYANIDEISAAIRDNQPGLEDEPEQEEQTTTVEPGTRIEHEGKWGEVLDPYGDGFRVRYDDGTEGMITA